jgi:fumarate hydratase class II
VCRKQAYYGAQTQRAWRTLRSAASASGEVIRALRLVKLPCRQANESLGLLDAQKAGAIREAAREVMEGRHDPEFVVDIFQTGSGTSTNMNANEVIANRAAELLNKPRGGKEIHPNDHVNMGQSSNDVIPTAIHVAALGAITQELLPALTRLRGALEDKARAFDAIIKIGRTHLNDATPIRLGQEFSGYARQVELGSERIAEASKVSKSWPLAARRGPASTATRSLQRAVR